MNRTKRMFGSVLLVMMFLVSSLYAEKKYPADALIKDVDFMVKSLNRIHPNPYTILPKSEFDARIQKAKEKIISEKEMDKLSFWKLLSPIIVSLRDHHTGLEPSFEPARMASKKIILPFKVLVYSNKTYIVSTPKENKDLLGAELLSINGENPVSLISNITLYKWQRELGDPSELGKKDYILFGSKFYHHIYMYLINNIKNKVTLEYIKNNQTNRRVVSLLSLAKLKKSKEIWMQAKMSDFLSEKTVLPKAKKRKSLIDVHDLGSLKSRQLKLLTSEIGYVQFDSFVLVSPYQSYKYRNNSSKRQELLKKSLEEYHSQLEAIFSRLKKEKVKNLIIDIENNGGGGDDTWLLLFGYLYKDKFKIHANSPAKTPKEWYDLLYRVNKFKKKDLPTFHWKNLHYTGRVYLIINRGVFSAAETFADVMKYYKVATLVGEETGGWKTRFGEFKRVNLPNTGLIFHISSKKFYSVDGTRDYFRGVRPDIKVQPSLEDFFDPAEFMFARVIKTVEMIETNK